MVIGGYKSLPCDNIAQNLDGESIETGARKVQCGGVLQAHYWPKKFREIIQGIIDVTSYQGVDVFAAPVPVPARPQNLPRRN